MMPSFMGYGSSLQLYFCWLISAQVLVLLALSVKLLLVLDIALCNTVRLHAMQIHMHIRRRFVDCNHCACVDVFST